MTNTGGEKPLRGAHQPNTPSPGRDNEALTGLRILIVDDQPANVTLLERLLQREGYAHIHSTTDPTRVLEICDHVKPDLLLLDLHMPQLDGFELMSRLQPLLAAEHVPILVLSGDITRDARLQALSLGARDFLHKPLDHVEVLLRVRNLLETRSLQLQLEDQNDLLSRGVAERTQELERVSAHRQHLLGLVMSAQEEERHRIAEGVHDDSLQTVAAVGLRLAVLRRRVEDPVAIDVLEGLQETVVLAAKRLRALLFELSPPELPHRGLVYLLRAYLEHVESEEGLSFAVDDRLPSDPDPEMRAFLYRVTREILMNVRKHAQASHVEVALTASDGRHCVRVRDDGVGFNPAEALRARPGHLGLAALTERLELAGGVLRIESKAGAGAMVELEVPAGGARPTSDHDSAQPPNPQ